MPNRRAIDPGTTAAAALATLAGATAILSDGDPSRVAAWTAAAASSTTLARIITARIDRHSAPWRRIARRTLLFALDLVALHLRRNSRK